MPTPLIKKLGIKPPMQILVISPPSEYLEMLAPLPDGVTISTQPKSASAFVQLFTTTRSGLRKTLPTLLNCIAKGGLLWIAYPKKSSGVASDLSRDEVCDIVLEFGWDSVTIVAIDETWSALRFRPVEEVRHTIKPAMLPA